MMAIVPFVAHLSACATPHTPRAYGTCSPCLLGAVHAYWVLIDTCNFLSFLLYFRTASWCFFFFPLPFPSFIFVPDVTPDSRARRRQVAAMSTEPLSGRGCAHKATNTYDGQSTPCYHCRLSLRQSLKPSTSSFLYPFSLSLSLSSLRHRYDWFGHADECREPSDEFRSRFIEYIAPESDKPGFAGA